MPRVYSSPCVHPMQILGDQLSALDAQHLIPTPQRVAEAKRWAEALVGALNASPAWMFQVEEQIAHGSLSRGTALRAFGDIDVLVLLDKAALRTGAGTDRTAEDTLRRMAQTLRDSGDHVAPPGEMVVRKQTHSVGVTFGRAKLRVDLVPAVRRTDGLYIPRSADGEWIRTFPDEVSARLRTVATECPWVKRAVRLLKSWRVRHKEQIPFSSYALETLMVGRADETNGQLASLVYGFFKEIADGHKGRRLELYGATEEPAPVLLEDPYTRANLTGHWSAAERQRLISVCREDLAQLKSALSLLNEKPNARLEPILRKIFLPTG